MSPAGFGNQNNADLNFQANLQDNVSPTADAIERKLKALGANKHEIKLYLKAYDQATSQLEQVRGHIRNMPKEVVMRVKADTSHFHQAVAEVRKIAASPVHMVVRLKHTADKDINELRAKYRGFADELTHMYQRIPVIGQAVGIGQQMATGIGASVGIPGAGALVGAAGAAGVGYGAFQVGQASFNTNAQREQDLITLSQTLRDATAAQKEMRNITSFSLQTPFNMRDVLASDIRMRSYGMNPQGRLSLTTAGNMAAAMGGGIGQATEALSEANLGYFARLRGYGVPLRQEDFSAGGKYQGMSYQAGVEKAMNRFSGAMELQAHTFKGIMSNLQDYVQNNVLQQGGSGMFGSIRDTAKTIQDKIESPGFMRETGQIIQKIQDGLSKMYSMIRQGVSYFKTNLLEPLKEVGSTVLRLGQTFAQTFGGTVVKGVKLFADAFTSIAAPIAKLIGSTGIGGLAVQLYALQKAFGFLGAGKTSKEFGELSRLLNPLTFSFTGLGRSLIHLPGLLSKLAMFTIIKQFMDLHSATDALNNSFKNLGDGPLAKLNLQADGLAIAFNKSSAAFKQMMVDFAAAEPAWLKNSDPKHAANLAKAYAKTASQVGNQNGVNLLPFGLGPKIQLPFTRTGYGLGQAGVDLFKNEVLRNPNIDLFGKEKYGSQGSMDMAANNVRQATSALKSAENLDSLASAAKQLKQGMDEFGKTLAPFRQDRASTVSQVKQMADFINKAKPGQGGLTDAQVRQYGGNTTSMLQDLVTQYYSPNADAIAALAKKNIRPGVKMRPEDIWNFKSSNFSNLSSAQLSGDFSFVGSTAKDLKDFYQGYFGRQRGVGIMTDRLRGMAGGLPVTIPGMPNIASEYGFTNINLNKLNTPQQNFNAITSAQGAASKLFNAIPGQQDKLAQIQNFVFQIQQAMDSLNDQMSRYQESAIIPVQRQMEDWNIVMQKTANRLADVSHQLDKAQWNMGKFHDGLLTGEQATMDNIHNMDLYLKRLNLLQTEFHSMQADLTSTTYHQGFESVVKPLMGFSLSREMQMASLRKERAQAQSDVTYGEQHYQLDKAARTLFQRQEMTFGERLKGIQENVKILDKGNLEQRKLADIQYNQSLTQRNLSMQLMEAQRGLRRYEDAARAYQHELFSQSRAEQYQQKKVDQMQNDISDWRQAISNLLKRLTGNMSLSPDMDAAKFLRFAVGSGGLTTLQGAALSGNTAIPSTSKLGKMNALDNAAASASGFWQNPLKIINLWQNLFYDVPKQILNGITSKLGLGSSNSLIGLQSLATIGAVSIPFANATRIGLLRTFGAGERFAGRTLERGAGADYAALRKEVFASNPPELGKSWVGWGGRNLTEAQRADYLPMRSEMSVGRRARLGVGRGLRMSGDWLYSDAGGASFSTLGRPYSWLKGVAGEIALSELIGAGVGGVFGEQYQQPAALTSFLGLKTIPGVIERKANSASWIRSGLRGTTGALGRIPGIGLPFKGANYFLNEVLPPRFAIQDAIMGKTLEPGGRPDTFLRRIGIGSPLESQNPKYLESILNNSRDLTGWVKKTIPETLARNIRTVAESDIVVKGKERAATQYLEAVKQNQWLAKADGNLRNTAAYLKDSTKTPEYLRKIADHTKGTVDALTSKIGSLQGRTSIAREGSLASILAGDSSGLVGRNFDKIIPGASELEAILSRGDKIGGSAAAKAAVAKLLSKLSNFNGLKNIGTTGRFTEEALLRAVEQLGSGGLIRATESGNLGSVVRDFAAGDTANLRFPRIGSLLGMSGGALARGGQELTGLGKFLRSAGLAGKIGGRAILPVLTALSAFGAYKQGGAGAAVNATLNTGTDLATFGIASKELKALNALFGDKSGPRQVSDLIGQNLDTPGGEDIAALLSKSGKRGGIDNALKIARNISGATGIKNINVKTLQALFDRFKQSDPGTKMNLADFTVKLARDSDITLRSSKHLENLLLQGARMSKLQEGNLIAVQAQLIASNAMAAPSRLEKQANAITANMRAGKHISAHDRHVLKIWNDILTGVHQLSVQQANADPSSSYNKNNGATQDHATVLPANIAAIQQKMQTYKPLTQAERQTFIDYKGAHPEMSSRLMSLMPMPGDKPAQATQGGATNKARKASEDANAAHLRVLRQQQDEHNKALIARITQQADAEGKAYKPVYDKSKGDFRTYLNAKLNDQQSAFGWLSDNASAWLTKIGKNMSSFDNQLGLNNKAGKLDNTKPAIKQFAHGGMLEADKYKVGPGRLVRVNEEGHDEVIIPLAPHRRERAKTLINETRQRIGAFANGGFTGPHGSLAGMTPVGNLAGRFGLSVTAGRNDHGQMTASGNVSDHSWGGALDVSNGILTKEEWAFANFFKSKLNGMIKQLIFNNTILAGGGLGGFVGGHKNHVHIALLQKFAENAGLTARIIHQADKGINVADLIRNATSGGTSLTLDQVPSTLKGKTPMADFLYRLMKAKRTQLQHKVDDLLGGDSSGTGNWHMGHSHHSKNWWGYDSAAASGSISRSQARGFINKAFGVLGINSNKDLWMKTVLRQIDRESSFQVNPAPLPGSMDINTRNGDPSLGLLQIIKENWTQYGKAPYNKNPLDPQSNIIAAMNYMIGTYGHGNKDLAAQVMWGRGGGAYLGGGVSYAGAFAKGGSFTTKGPTMFLAGERGTERINVTPLGEDRATKLLAEIASNIKILRDTAVTTAFEAKSSALRARKSNASTAGTDSALAALKGFSADQIGGGSATADMLSDAEITAAGLAGGAVTNIFTKAASAKKSAKTWVARVKRLTKALHTNITKQAAKATSDTATVNALKKQGKDAHKALKNARTKKQKAAATRRINSVRKRLASAQKTLASDKSLLKDAKREQGIQKTAKTQLAKLKKKLGSLSGTAWNRTDSSLKRKRLRDLRRLAHARTRQARDAARKAVTKDDNALLTRRSLENQAKKALGTRGKLNSYRKAANKATKKSSTLNQQASGVAKNIRQILEGKHINSSLINQALYDIEHPNVPTSDTQFNSASEWMGDSLTGTDFGTSKGSETKKKPISARASSAAHAGTGTAHLASIAHIMAQHTAILNKIADSKVEVHLNQKVEGAKVSTQKITKPVRHR